MVDNKGNSRLAISSLCCGVCSVPSAVLAWIGLVWYIKFDIDSAAAALAVLSAMAVAVLSAQLSIILGCAALFRIARRGRSVFGRRFAITGIVIGCIMDALYVWTCLDWQV